MKKIYGFLLLIILSLEIYAQSNDIIISPYPFGLNDKITITIKSNNSCNSLKEEIMYMHSGVGTDENSWLFLKGKWGEDDGVGKMTKNNDGTHSITIIPKKYFSVSAGKESTIKKMGLVFRNHDGTKKWEYSEAGICSGADYFVGVGNFQINLESPIVSRNNTVVLNAGDNLKIKVTSTESANFSIKENDIEIKTYTNVTEIIFNKEVTSTKEYSIDVNNGNETKKATLTVVIPPKAIVEPLPKGMRDGINYYTNDKTKITLVLHAPNKKFVYVKGDFSDWKIKPEYQMKATKADTKNPDIRYWLTIDKLKEAKEYAFQYVVDAKKIIADPYAEKILDPWNDKHITSEIYPNLKPYPASKTEGIVSVFQPGQTEYNWKTVKYSKPPKNNLIIYELLVRDFVNKHSYQSIIDTLDYIEKLNVNAIEFMPINEFEGNESWGYNPSFMFAPDKYYGTKNKLKELIDEIHKRGIVVIIDIVMNHSFGQSPFVQLYNFSNGDGQILMNEDTPWFNRKSPNTDYHWGADFNHESMYTQALLDSINHFWMKEYKIDGFRFDFTKGFTNKVGSGHGYDQSRINILKRMYDKIIKINPSAYVILEHFVGNDEEKALAEHGIMLWGNMVSNYSEAAMGYNGGGKSNLGWASYKKRGWSKPNLVTYTSSHDEERIAYKNSAYGNKSGTYDIKKLETNMQRMQLQAMFSLPIPGSKMIWQFDELGYDISIDDNCRVCNKPIKWEYTRDVNRRKVYNLHKAIIKLKKSEPVFSTSDFSLNVDNGALKSIILKHSDMNVVIVGNFDVVKKSINVTFPSTGTWNNFFEDSKYEVSTASQNISLAPGEYKMFTTKKLDKPNLEESILGEDVALSIENIKYDEQSSYIDIYPVPIKGMVTVKYSISAKSNVILEVFDLQGRKIKYAHKPNQKKGAHTFLWNVDNDMKKGVYIIRVSTPLEILSRMVTVF